MGKESYMDVQTLYLANAAALDKALESLESCSAARDADRVIVTIRFASATDVTCHVSATREEKPKAAQEPAQELNSRAWLLPGDN